MKMSPTSTLLSNAQSGFALLPVSIALVVVAGIVLLINYQGASSVSRVAIDAESSQAHYVAEAGMQHALWQARNSKCTGDFSIPTTAIGSDSYSASTTGGGTTTSYTLAVDQDAWIRSDDIDKNNGAATDLHIRFETGKVEQPLVRFDLSTLPANAQINSASLWFYIEPTKAHPEGPVTIHRITADWTEDGVTWDSFNGSYDPAAIGTINAQANSAVWVQVNITSQVQAWVNGEPNYGVLLNSVAEGIHAEYISSEGAPTVHPYLDVIVGSGPVSTLNVQATGTLSNGVTRTITRPTTSAYQHPSAATLQLGADSGIDAMLNSFYANRDYGNHELQVSIGSGSTIENALLQFDLSSIPIGTRIISAQLELYHYVTTGTPASPGVDVHRLMRNWVEGTHDGTGTADGATWNTWNGNDNWSNAGGDYESTPVASSVISAATSDWESWEIGELVQGWIDGSYPNYGVILKGKGVLDVSFASKEDADSALHPKLNITYAIECGMASHLPKGVGNVLMVIGNSPSNPSAHEQEIRDVIESWGYSVTLIQDDDSQGNFDAQAATHDVVYVSETVSSNNVGTKLTNFSIGVVNEQGNLNDELGMASSKANPVGASLNVVDNNHYITYPFQSGVLEIYSKDMEGLTVSGTEAPDLQRLANWSTTGGLVVLDSSMQTTSGGTAAGRRVMLPLGRSTNSNFNWNYLNNNGRLIVQRALQWAKGDTGMPAVNLLMVVVNPSSLTTQEATKKNLIESWGFAVNLIDESDNQTAFDDAVAVNDVVFITEDVTASNVNTKLVNASIGVVTEEANLSDEFGLSEGIAWDSGTQIEINDNSHYITLPFSTGLLAVMTTSESLAYATPAIAPDLNQLASSLSGYGVLAIDTGDLIIGGGTAAGRRVQLPWGGNNMDVAHLTADGLTIFKRSLEWGAGTENPDFSTELLFVVADPAALTSAESAKKSLIETWGFTVNLIDDADSVNNFVDAFATNGVMYVSGEVSDTAIGSKLIKAPLGIVNEQISLHDELLLSTSAGTNDFNRIFVINNTHYITEGINTGWHFIATSDQPLNALEGTLAPGMTNLAEVWITGANYDFGLAVVDTGGQLNGGEIAAGRRAQLPWGTADFDFGALNANGQNLMRRAIEWAGGAEIDLSPMAHWMLDDGTGATALDSEGGHHGTLSPSGPTWVAGYLDDALQFDGSDDYVDLTSDEELDDVFVGGATVMAWINPTGWGENGYGRIFDKSSSPSSTNDGWAIRLNVDNGGIINFGQGFSSERGWWKIPNGSISLNTWQHIAIAYDASSTSNDPVIYLDGNPLLVTEVDTPSGTILSDASINLRLGNHAGGTSHTFEGKIDDARIYDRMMDDSEIAAIASEGGGGGGGGPGPVMESYADAGRDTNGTFLDILKPSGTVAGDLLVAAVAVDGDRASSLHADNSWTPVNIGANASGRVTFGVWWKLATAGEASDYRFGWSGNEQAYGWIMRFSGHDPSSPIYYDNGALTNDNTSEPICQRLITPVDNMLVLRLGGFDDDDITVGDPGLDGHTAINMDESGTGNASTSGGSGYFIQTTAGDSGLAWFQLTNNEQMRTVTLGIRPAP